MKKLKLPIKKIIEDYNNGLGCYKLSQKYNCSHSSINNYLKKNGINTKRDPNHYRKYTLNENYFEVINTEDKAYFLGLLYSDGCVYKNTINLSLQYKDSPILQQLKNLIEYTGQLYDIKPRTNTHQPQRKLSFSSKKVVKDLSLLNIIPNKSLTIKFPTYKQVPKKLMNHFIRGVFDGDGTANISKRVIKNKYYDECSISIIGSNDFISGLYDEIKFGNIYKTNNDNNSTIFFKSKFDILKIIDYLYKNSTISLSRKYKMCLKIKKHLECKKYYYSGEKIDQYTCEGIFIKTWGNINEIKKLTEYRTDTILRNIRGKIKTSNGFIWKLNEIL